RKHLTPQRKVLSSPLAVAQPRARCHLTYLKVSSLDAKRKASLVFPPVLPNLLSTRMKTVVIGKSSLVSSRLAFGCWRIAGTWDAQTVTPDAMKQGRQAAF